MKSGFYQGGTEPDSDYSEEQRSAFRAGMNRAFEIITGDSFLFMSRDISYIP